jgi:hypothetical protein
VPDIMPDVVPDVVPAGVREVLRHRLARLSAGCADLLGHASVLGTESTMDVLHRVAGLDPDDATALVEEAVRAAVVVRPAGTRRRGALRARPVPRDGVRRARPGRPRAPPSRRRAGPDRPIHGRARRCGGGGGGAPAARRRAAAADAARWAAVAGEEAAGRLAYEDACAHFERAWPPGGRPVGRSAGAAGSAGGGGAALRLRLLLGLGAAQHRSGRTEAARESLRAAVAAARELSDVDALGTAALGLHRLGARAGTADAEADAVLAEAIAALS